MDEPKFEQHFLVNVDAYRNLLKSLDLEGCNILEIGVGTGILTRLILEQNINRLIGYEINTQIDPNIQDPRFEMIYADFFETNLSFLKENQYCIVSNAPYSLLPFLKKKIQEHRIENVILMVSPKYLYLFPEYKVEFVLDGAKDFHPSASGTHFVIRRRFKLKIN